MKNYFQFILEKKNNINKKLIEQFGDIRVYKVNGEKVRDINKEDEEFGLASIHEYLSLIPKNEIWIEDDIKENEIPILMYSYLYQIKLINNGESPKTAYKKSLEQEKRLRDKLIQQQKNPSKTDKKAKDEVYIKKYCDIGDIEVWLVDAEIVRDLYKTDFMEGGHGYVYKWIPNNEIWIENRLHKDEIPYIILHEYIERILMKEKGIKYENAHNTAAKSEWSKRPNKFTKKDAEKLTSETALELSKK